MITGHTRTLGGTAPYARLEWFAGTPKDFTHSPQYGAPGKDVGPIEVRVWEHPGQMKKMSHESILRHVLLAGSDSLNVFDGLFEGGYSLQQDPQEVTRLITFLLERDRRFVNCLEVGSAAGGFSRLLDDFLAFHHVYVVDDNRHAKAGMRPMNLPHATEFIGDSQSEAFRRQLEHWAVGFDLVVIDADHSYQGVRRDTEQVLPFCNRDCLIIFHDSKRSRGVARWVGELERGSLPSVRHLVSFKNRLGLSVFEHLRGRLSETPPTRLPGKTNLIYHVCPRPGDILEFNLQELSRYLDCFNNKIIVNIAEGPGLIPAEHIEQRIRGDVRRAHLDANSVRFLRTPNANTGETTPFFRVLLPLVARPHQREYTFYAHTKGITRGMNPCVRLWVDLSYQHNLANPRAVCSLLDRHACLGSFLRRGGQHHGNWHYSGSFFWLNNARIFCDSVWKRHTEDRWGVESWLGRFVPYDEACCCFGRGLGSLYYSAKYRPLGGAKTVRRHQELL